MFNIELLIEKLYDDMENWKEGYPEITASDFWTIIEFAFNSNLEIKGLNTYTQKLEFINDVLIHRLRELTDKGE